MPGRSFINRLEPNQLVEGIFVVHNCQLGLTQSGKPFLKCLLSDRTGRTAGRMWNATEELYQSLPTNGFVSIRGQTQPYQGELQIIIQEIAAAVPREDELLELLPSTAYDIDWMFDQASQILDSIEHAAIAMLARQYLEDEPLMAKFRRAPAAMTLHHAFIGGLLEHTLSLLRLSGPVCSHYPKLSRDLVVMGAFLHDLGKCAELSWEQGFEYTEDGHLVGHIARGVLWLQAKADRCAEQGTPVPESVLRVLHHIILSHHGKPEFGALKVPATPEAILISQLDNLDAKLQMAIAAARPDKGEAVDRGGNFTEKLWALDTRLYRPDPTTI